MKGFLHMKKKIIPALVVLILIVIIIAIAGISALIKKYTPSKDVLSLNEYYNISAEDQVAIILNRELNEAQAKVIDGYVYLDYSFVHDTINSRFYWDANENILFYATDSELISANADSSSYQVTKSTVDYGHPVVKANSDSCYIDIDFVRQYSDFTYEYATDPNRLLINNSWGSVNTASIKKNTQVRQKGGIKSPILKEVTKGDAITIIEEDDKWTKVMTADGVIGYVKSKLVTDKQAVELKNDSYAAETFSHIVKDGKICMAWHQVTTTSANDNVANVLARTKGINVISPTWFYLNDNNGNLHDIASSSYVSYCHSQGVEVWALVSNLENSDVDSTYVLTHSSTRQNLVNQIVASAIKYELDGINVDFEALDGNAVGDAYIEFIRELSIKCGNNGITLSVDNYVPSAYTAFYNRGEQANFADYVVIMGYDEHYAGSGSGSVSSLSWVTQAVSDTLEQVPAEQVVLGMPFYTRLWELTPLSEEDSTDVTDTEDELSQYSVTSTAYGMDSALSVVNANGAVITWDEESGQNYAEWNADGKTYKIWLEDTASLEKRLELMASSNLAGASFWKLGFENDATWDTIIKYIN